MGKKRQVGQVHRILQSFKCLPLSSLMSMRKFKLKQNSRLQLNYIDHVNKMNLVIGLQNKICLSHWIDIVFGQRLQLAVFSSCTSWCLAFLKLHVKATITIILNDNASFLWASVGRVGIRFLDILSTPVIHRCQRWVTSYLSV